MGLSKHAREEVDAQIRALFLAFAGGIRWTSHGLPTFDDVFRGFVAWMEEHHPDHGDYVTREACKLWWAAS